MVLVLTGPTIAAFIGAAIFFQIKKKDREMVVIWIFCKLPEMRELQCLISTLHTPIHPAVAAKLQRMKILGIVDDRDSSLNNLITGLAISGYQLI